MANTAAKKAREIFNEYCARLVEKVVGNGCTYRKVMETYDKQLYLEIDGTMNTHDYILLNAFENKGYTITKEYDPVFRDCSYVIRKEFTSDPNEKMYNLTQI